MHQEIFLKDTHFVKQEVWSCEYIHVQPKNLQIVWNVADIVANIMTEYNKSLQLASVELKPMAFTVPGSKQLYPETELLRW